jgi:peptide/nickel transport system substrate-binding protein
MKKIKEWLTRARAIFGNLVLTARARVQKFLENRAKRRAQEKKLLLDKKLIALVRRRGFPNVKNIILFKRILSHLEQRIFDILAVFLVVSGLSLAAQAYLAATREVPKLGGDYSEGIVGSPRFINPLYSAANQVDSDISRLVFSSLFRKDAAGNLINDLTENVMIKGEGKEYYISLKRNVTFHDGHELKAEDVLFIFEAIKNKDYKSQLRPVLGGISAKIIDDYTIEFILDSPNPIFPAFLTFGVLPAHLWKDIKPSDAHLAVLNIKPTGSGPYKFQSLTKDKQGLVRSITLRAANNYYGGAPKISQLALVFYPLQDEAARALGSKDIDGLAFFGAQIPEHLRRRTDLHILKPKTFQYNALFFNLSRSLAGSSEIRQSLALSLNRQAIASEVVKNTGLLMAGPIPPELLPPAPNEVPEVNLAEAGKILDQDSWTLADDGVRKKIIKAKNKKEQDQELLLEINLTTTDDEGLLAVAEIIKASWGNLGAKINLEVVPRGAIGEILRQRNYDILLYGQALGQDLDLYPFWHSSEINFPGLNLSLFRSREADILLQNARKEAEFEKKLPYYQDLAKIFSRELPAIFLWSPKSNYAVSARVKGIKLEQVINPADRFAGITEWYIKSGRVFK